MKTITEAFLWVADRWHAHGEHGVYRDVLGDQFVVFSHEVPLIRVALWKERITGLLRRPVAAEGFAFLVEECHDIGPFFAEGLGLGLAHHIEGSAKGVGGGGIFRDDGDAFKTDAGATGLGIENMAQELAINDDALS